MESFIRVVKSGSFTVAAKDLGTSRALITKHIIELEGRLGARLLNRTARKVTLTEIGAEYFAFCAKFVAEIADKESSAASPRGEPRGVLRIVASKSFGALHLATAVAEFAKSHPRLRLSLILRDPTEDATAAAMSDFDIAIWLPSSAMGASLLSRRIGTLETVLCASPRYLKEAGAPRKPSDLMKMNCLIYLAPAPVREWRFAKARRQLSINVSGSYSSNSMSAIRDAAIEHVGIALLPSYFVAQDLREGVLKAVLKPYLPESLPLYAFSPTSRIAHRNVRLFTSYIEAWLAERAWDADA